MPGGNGLRLADELRRLPHPPAVVFVTAHGEHALRAFEVEAARIMATRAALANAEVNVQNHGGIGFTWEHPAHRFVTRARLLELTGGSPADHQAALLAAPAPIA